MNSDDSADDRLQRRAFMGAGLGVAALATLATARRAQAGALATSHIINVIDEGADPTGGLDSTGPIQTAINKAVALNGEAAVLFPTGKYRITDTLRIMGPSRSQTIGNISFIGMRASIVQSAAGKDIIRFENTHHCMIKDLYLSATPQSGHGIVLINSIRTVLENVEVFQVGGNCLYADIAFWLSAYDCIFSLPGPNKYAVHHLSAMNNVSYYHCRFAGTQATYDRGGLFTAYDPTPDGATAVVSLVACDFSSCKLALNLRAGANTYVANCYFEANQYSVQWGAIVGEDDLVTGERVNDLGWPVSGTIDNCYFINRISGQESVFLLLKRGTNLRINNPIFYGNGTGHGTGHTTAIKISSIAQDGDLRRVVIDDHPYHQWLLRLVDDPNPSTPTDLRRLKVPVLTTYT